MTNCKEWKKVDSLKFLFIKNVMLIFPIIPTYKKYKSKVKFPAFGENKNHYTFMEMVNTIFYKNPKFGFLPLANFKSFFNGGSLLTQ